MGEFELIERFFKRRGTSSPNAGREAEHVKLGIGDDCALLQPAPGTQLAISSDMLVAGRHFFQEVDPAALGHKALAVNLSDLAACGARPLAFTLALALPEIDEPWLAAFSSGLFSLADTHGCALIGGDTTRGPLNICITVFGEVPVVNGRSQALLRSGARAGDDVYVSGNLGDARLALEALTGKLTLDATLLLQTRARLERPTPRVALGLALRGIASAAIDVSDGLVGDLGHILKASCIGATLQTDAALGLLAASSLRARALESAATPSSAATSTPSPAPLSPQHLLTCVLAGGDDYELAFTAPPAARAAVLAAAAAAQTVVTRIGQVDAAPGLRLMDASGQPLANDFRAFDHFK